MDFIHKKLLNVGVPASLSGFPLLHDAIETALKDRSVIRYVTKNLYPTLAKKYEITPSQVERRMGRAIEVAFFRGNVELLDDYFGHSVNPNKGKATITEFIAVMTLVCGEENK